MILFVLMLEYFDLLNNTSLIIFMVTVISLAMVFGVGYLLITYSGPVRASSMDIPNTVLFFVKGGIVLYFISLLGYFHILPNQITSILLTVTAFILMMVGVLSYIWEVVQRSRRLPRPKRVPRYRVRVQRHRGWQL
ncbi:MAG: hypothetical protein AYK23_00005 [Candidatus Proteinoplasmatales archaeon SG8-5]|nr:MAG: hypothetical protein AYK23_00005 [Candidatus Proteinoplasmatales archaeon SG8-5]